MYTRNYINALIRKNLAKKRLSFMIFSLEKDLSLLKEALKCKEIDISLYNGAMRIITNMDNRYNLYDDYFIIDKSRDIIDETYNYEKYYILEMMDGTKKLVQSVYSKNFCINGIKYGNKLIILEDKLNKLLKRNTCMNNVVYYYKDSFLEKQFFKNIIPASSLYTEEEISNFKNLLKDKITRIMLKGFINEV